MDKKMFSEIMRDYERIRQKNNRMVSDKKKYLYQRVPRLYEIEKELTGVLFDITKFILNKNNTSLQHALSLEQKLLQEKKNIFDELNLSEDYFCVYDCSLCKDTGYIENKKCKCFEQKLIDRYYDMSGLKDIISKENFETFDFELYSDKTNIKDTKSPLQLAKLAHKKSIDFIKKFGIEFNNILFYGSTGVGKTFFCHCIAKSLLDKGYTVLYTTMPQIFRNPSDTYFDKTKSESNRMIFESDLLMIDDLGLEFLTKSSRSVLFNIINSRLMLRKPVVISTNLSLVGLEQNYSETLSSRIVGNYELLKLTGEDIRLQVFRNKNKKYRN